MRETYRCWKHAARVLLHATARAEPATRADLAMTEPASQPGSQSGSHSGSQPGPQPGSQPGSHPGSQPGSHPGSRPTSDPAVRPTSDLAVQRVSQPEADWRSWMAMALTEAAAAPETGDVPVGAVVVNAAGEVIGRGRNAREARQDPTAHAEILALQAAAAHLGSWRLAGCTLVVTLEPCAMCAGALVLARVARLVLAAWDPKAGAAGSMRDIVRDSRLNHQVEVIGGIREREAGDLLRTFFATHRS
jgi:tRNA(adenine34) deaminase